MTFAKDNPFISFAFSLYSPSLNALYFHFLNSVGPLKRGGAFIGGGDDIVLPMSGETGVGPLKDGDLITKTVKINSYVPWSLIEY